VFLIISLLFSRVVVAGSFAAFFRGFAAAFGFGDFGFVGLVFLLPGSVCPLHGFSRSVRGHGRISLNEVGGAIAKRHAACHAATRRGRTGTALGPVAVSVEALALALWDLPSSLLLDHRSHRNIHVVFLRAVFIDDAGHLALLLVGHLLLAWDIAGDLHLLWNHAREGHAPGRELLWLAAAIVLLRLRRAPTIGLLPGAAAVVLHLRGPGAAALPGGGHALFTAPLLGDHAGLRAHLPTSGVNCPVLSNHFRGHHGLGHLRGPGSLLTPVGDLRHIDLVTDGFKGAHISARGLCLFTRRLYLATTSALPDWWLPRGLCARRPRDRCGRHGAAAVRVGRQLLERNPRAATRRSSLGDGRLAARILVPTHLAQVGVGADSSQGEYCEDALVHS